MSENVNSTSRPGPLQGVRVVEFEGLGPSPFAAMLLADLGAEVIRIGRPTTESPSFIPKGEMNALNRGRLGTVQLDLKTERDLELALQIISAADILIEGFRPGVMERLGLGPEACASANARLVYARMTGWGQHGPLAQQAGHDINYLSLTGALHAIGRKGQAPVPPLSLVGDYGGGGMFLVVGILAALMESRKSGTGQIVDGSIVDGVNLLLSSVWSRVSEGTWTDARGENLLDSGAPFYDVYVTRCGGYMAVGSLEPHFFDRLTRTLGLQERWSAANQNDKSQWAKMRSDIAAVFQQKARNEWEALFQEADACVTPVLSLSEALVHPANLARAAHSKYGSAVQASPAPRFSKTTLSMPDSRSALDTKKALLSWGVHYPNG